MKLIIKKVAVELLRRKRVKASSEGRDKGLVVSPKAREKVYREFLISKSVVCNTKGRSNGFSFVVIFNNRLKPFFEIGKLIVSVKHICR